MTREELYKLIWERPMTKVSKDFGLSDVGLRKICVKFNVPTPPLGYWAKLAHGKAVKKTAPAASATRYAFQYSANSVGTSSGVRSNASA